MKKLFGLFAALIMIFSLASVTAFAAEYTEFNIVFEEKEGAKVNSTEIKVFASINEDTLKDRTGDFTLEGVDWFKYLQQPEAGKTAEDYDYVDEELKIYGILCTDDDVFDHKNFSYFLRISRLYAQEEDIFQRNVKINGVDVDEMNGSCYNTGSEFFIKTVTNGGSSGPEEKTTAAEEPENTEAPTNTEAPESTEPSGEKCKVCGICPIQPLGICLFIWLAIIVIVVILVIILITKNRKSKK